MRELTRIGTVLAALAAPGAVALACAGRSVPPAEASTAGTPTSSSSTGRAPPVRAVPVPAQSASALPPAVPSGAIGTEQQVALAAVANEGRFCFICQPREDTDADGKLEVTLGPRGEPTGDPLALSLVIGAGPGEIVDDLLALDPAGRFAVIRRGDQVLLLDAVDRSEIDLGARGALVDDDALPHPEHRALSFDAAGHRLVDLRAGEGRTEAVVRELATGREVSIDPGPGNLWRVRLDPSGRWLVFSMISEDRDGNGRLDWPVPHARGSRFPCTLPTVRRAAHWPRPDAVSFVVAEATGGRARSEPWLVTPLGEHLLLREPGGRLLLEDARGRRTEIAPASCEARVGHADGERGLALVSCKRAPGKPLLRLVGNGVDLDLGLEGQPRTDAWVTRDPSRLVAVYPGQEAALVDHDERRVHPLTSRDLVLGTHGSRALVLRSARLVIEDVSDGSSSDLGVTSVNMPEVFQSGAIVVASPYVVDLATSTVLGQLERRPLALVPSGRVLVALGGDADASQLARGPLSWVEPLPITLPVPGASTPANSPQARARAQTP